MAPMLHKSSYNTCVSIQEECDAIVSRPAFKLPLEFFVTPKTTALEGAVSSVVLNIRRSSKKKN